MKQHGLGPKDVSILALGDNVARIAALKTRSVDAAVIAAPGDMKAVEEGFKILLEVGDIYRLPMGGITATVTKTRENAAEVRKVVRAVVRATRFIVDLANKEDVVKYIEGFFKLSKGPAEEFYGRLIPALSASGMVDRDKIKLVIDSAVERGLTDKPLDPDRVVDFSFVKELRS